MNALKTQAENFLEEADGYLKTLNRSLITKSRFNNDLLYGIAAMTFEKLLVSLLANHGSEALHHTPLALFKEASLLVEIPESFMSTAKLLMQFESICSFEGFGYKTPTDEQLKVLIVSLQKIREFVFRDRMQLFQE